MSPDGSLVAFESAATDLVTGDTNAASDVFAHALAGGVTQRVSVTSGGPGGNGSSTSSRAVSADGRYVAFYVPGATNLVPGDTNATSDVFVHDNLTGSTWRASVDSAGAQGNAGSQLPSISADGRYVAFFSMATNLVSVGDTNNALDVFVHDNTTGTTRW